MTEKSKRTFPTLTKLPELFAELMVMSHAHLHQQDEGERAGNLAMAGYAIAELLERQGDVLLISLLPLLNHPHPWVRYYAAMVLKANHPERARAMLEDLIQNFQGMATVYARINNPELDKSRK